MSNEKTVLSYEEIIHYGSTADMRLELAQTPGLRPFSSEEKAISFFTLLIFSVIFYIHTDIHPFLPITLSIGTTNLLKLLSFVGLGICLALTFKFIVNVVSLILSLSMNIIKMRNPKVTCTKCGRRNKLSKFADGENCKKCHSDSVYCGNCGMPVSFSRLREGKSCEKCSANTVSIRY